MVKNSSWVYGEWEKGSFWVKGWEGGGKWYEDEDILPWGGEAVMGDWDDDGEEEGDEGGAGAYIIYRHRDGCDTRL